MKICILSMQRVSNFGSLLQGYALKCMLEQQGHSVEFLDIAPNEEDNRLLAGKQNRFIHEGEAFGTVLAKLKKLDQYTINRLRIKYLSKKQDAMFDAFRTDVLGIKAGANMEQYDCCVIGSDEVFNCLSGATWGFTSQLFGNVPQAKRVITYAASCGATCYEDVPEAARDRIRETFGNVSAFSVRDKNTYDFASRLTEKTVREHLDPVLVVDFTQEINDAPMPEGLPERYCIVYSYYNRFCEERDIQKIKQFCKRNNMVPVAVGAPQMWIRHYPVLTPFEMLKVFQNAAFVITDTFHGTIFSAKYASRFAVVVRQSNSNKLGDLLNRMGMESHRITTVDQLDDIYMRECDTERIEGILRAERLRSEQYLKENILRG